jgi:hypothetical protein
LLADTVKGTAEDLRDTAVDLTRRQPALVFGLASLAGFRAYRTVKNAQTVAPTSSEAESEADNPTRTSTARDPLKTSSFRW